MELAELNAWFHGWTSDGWDPQMEADARAGRFDELVREGEEEFGAGECRPFA